MTQEEPPGKPLSKIKGQHNVWGFYWEGACRDPDSAAQSPEKVTVWKSEALSILTSSGYTLRLPCFLATGHDPHV